MKPIDRIYILCNIRDVHLARICVASARYFYPDIPISVVADQFNGPFDCSEIEQYWEGVRIEKVENSCAGQGYVKLELMARNTGERVLMLDADIIFAGPVLERLAEFDEDLIICPEPNPRPEDPKWCFTYYRPDLAKQIRPEFVFPNAAFNSGQIVATSGKIPMSAWEEFAEYSSPVRLKQREAFRTDQGLYNFVFFLLAQEGKLTIAQYHFFIWGFSPKMKDLSLEQIKQRKGPAKLIHWAGPKPPFVQKLPGGDLLKFFEDFYYSKIPGGGTKRRMRALHRLYMEYYAKVYRRIKGKNRYI